ncbi:MAG: transglycosylase domain-containing protein, partial [Erysipelotrichaceae bacterium]|nr:transglycosylase domain-containing protein [Erysipelotrichaceae bacterium]MDY5252455.1 biosynthetic peptidoglycan transglycosylase [Erysipelotrichaceae bacterium]
MKKVGKLIFKLTILLLCAAIIIGLIFLRKGYKLYQQQIMERPLTEVVNEIMRKDDFVPYEQISEDFCDAVVAIEDHRFWFRDGIDYIAIGRALVVNIATGSVSEGGSTITQQLAKNLYFSNQPSLVRKIAEIFFVHDLESMYTKEEILSLYVNIIYYGDGYYGIKQAANGYYDKEPSELDLYESAMLAGLPQAPSIYQLSTGLEKAQKRQKQVLDAMVLYEFITQQDMDAALAAHN